LAKKVVAQMVEEFSYGRFKDGAGRSRGCGERDYTHALRDVWSRLNDLQKEKQE
jgi:hypothetical protein